MNVVIKINDKTKEKMLKYYEDKKREKVPPYAVFQAQDLDTIVTLYESGKCMFQGPSADIDANMWQETSTIEKKDKTDLSKYYYASCLGSDEVGTGDYFGPVVVTACYIEKKDIKKLEELQVKDSKKLTDEIMLRIAPKIVKIVKYKSLILTNKEYNQKYSKETNLNKIKAIMHNKCLYSLLQEIPKPEYIIVDEFAKEKRYYEYLNNSENIVKNITFLTKGEDKNLAVACASILSRYLFLKEFNKLSDKYHIPLPKGSGANVDKIGKELIEKNGKEVLDEIAKKNFSNTKRILGTLII